MATEPGSIPRYAQPMDRQEDRTCGGCACCKDVPGCDRCACVHGIFHAVKLERLVLEDLVMVRPGDEACDGWVDFEF